MIRQTRILIAATLLSAIAPATAAPATSLPAAVIPTVQCIRHALQSDSAVQSVSLYSIDARRFAVEYTFRNPDNRIVVSDIELSETSSDGNATEGDKIPVTVSEETLEEESELQMRVDFHAKCHLHSASDNVYPQPAARAGWRKLDWPGE